ncbi:hypothetical protein [Acidianus brierleyi]|uniref:Uncharacterized protein n=1 Tax=Acidianus brierleyi TaxID=41673 RepID=A0A2U9IB67_9CREN|nr:hypothetical protein [Acidianus brierleyi]AWR93261.1 hypothetical protein DFR85_00175 [Acidianus brierleyi]
MKKIYFLIPLIILIIALIPLIFISHHTISQVEVEGEGILGYGYLSLEKGIGENISMYYINVTVNNPGKSEAICYAKNNDNTISFNCIYVFVNGKYYGESIPPGLNNITILVNHNITLPYLDLYLGNGQNLIINIKK